MDLITQSRTLVVRGRASLDGLIQAGIPEMDGSLPATVPPLLFFFFL